MFTVKQAETLDQLRAAIIEYRSHGEPERHEFKSWEVREHGSSLSLVCEYGRKGDEGTMLELLGRYRYHMWISRKGGVKLLSFSSNLQSTSKNLQSVRGVHKCATYWHTKKEKRS